MGRVGRHPVNKELIDQIAKLRYQGYSHVRVANMLNIGETTSKKYGPKDAITISTRHKDQFTERQMQIAIKALETIEKHGIIPQAYWHKDL
jgi:ribosomal protein L32E